MLNDWLAPAILFTVVGATWSLAWWFSHQFTKISGLIHNKTEQLQTFFLDKLEYHERHDDNRFNLMLNQIWEIRLRNATKDGVLPSKVLEEVKEKD